MDRSSLSAALAVALGLSLAFPAAAADRASHATDANSAARTARAPGSAQKAHEVRVSKLIGTKVHDRAGKTLGDVKDVILDTNTGRVHYAVLSSGGILGMGGKLFAVPLSKVRQDAKGKLVLNLDAAQLGSASTFENEHWPNWNDTQYRAELDRRYGGTPDQHNATFRRASDVMRARVRDSHGADIGAVKEMVVDLAGNRVDYVVVEFDRAWNPNDKLVALPMASLADGANAVSAPHDAHAAAPPRNPPPVLALGNASEPTKGTASAVNPPGSVETRPPALDPGPGARVRPLEREPLKTTTSYADDENLVYKGAREQLLNAPAFDRGRYPD